MGENDKRSLNFAKALSTSFYFQKIVWTTTFLNKLELIVLESAMFLNIQVFKGIFRWKFLWATNNISYASLLPSFCNWLSAFISELDKWLYMLTIQVAWIGLRTESRRSTSTSSRTIPESSWLWICAEYQSRELVFYKLFCFSINSQIIFRWRWVVRFSARYTQDMWNLCKLPLLITQDAKWSLPGKNLLFMSIISCTCRCWSCLSSFLCFKFLTITHGI